MNAHLQAAVDLYPASELNRHIHPISMSDAQIIIELTELCAKAGIKSVVEILKQYKFNSDEDTLLALAEVNKNLTQVPKKESEIAGPPEIIIDRYLVTCGRRIDILLIIGYDSIDVEYDNSKIEPAILLNPTPKEAKLVPYYANCVLQFATEKDRNEIIDKMDKWFQLYRGKFL